jgi:tetratricopeptide (TPR) repeat protein
MTRFIGALLLAAATALHAQSPSPEYEKALELIHAFNGAGDELEQAMQLAQKLEASQPESGYAQTLIAEMVSTWQLREGGQPAQSFATAVKFASTALQLNPRLAQAHVARARALLKAGQIETATKDIDAALALEPNLSGALFIRADLYRRTGRVEEAELWYRKFIAATPSPQRKSNGYAWMGEMYKRAAWDQPRQWAAYVAKARDAYQKSVDLDPGGPWKTVNFAIFLNNEAADYEAAEQYAQKALALAEFPMARYHLAAARYQKLSVKAGDMDKAALRAAVGEIHKSTGMSLQETLDFCEGCTGIRSRLDKLGAALEAR